MSWDKVGEIPDEVVVSCIQFAEDLAGHLPDSEESDEIIERVFAAVHPRLPARITLELLQGRTRFHTLKVDTDIKELTTQGKVVAIKSIREYTGLGLKESKSIVDAAKDGPAIEAQVSVDRDKRVLLREKLKGSGYILT